MSHRRNLDGNLAALDRYLGEMDRAGAWEEMQVEVDDAILDAEGIEPTKGSIGWLCDAAFFAEMVEDIKAHRAAGKRDSWGDWQADDCFFEFVHGVLHD